MRPALVFLSGINPLSTHKGVFALFHRERVSTGLMEAEYAKILKEEREERWLGDYSVEEEFDYERAKFRLKEARQFVKRAKAYLKGRETGRETG